MFSNAKRGHSSLFGRHKRCTRGRSARALPPEVWKWTRHAFCVSVGLAACLFTQTCIVASRIVFRARQVYVSTGCVEHDDGKYQHCLHDALPARAHLWHKRQCLDARSDLRCWHLVPPCCVTRQSDVRGLIFRTTHSREHTVLSRPEITDRGIGDDFPAIERSKVNSESAQTNFKSSLTVVASCSNMNCATRIALLLVFRGDRHVSCARC